MRVRLGFVAMSLRLQDSSPSKTVTVTNITKIQNRRDQIGRLTRLARENLGNTLRILRANEVDRIKVYRFTSKLIPLATHPLFSDWDYIADLKEEFLAIGSFVKSHQMRVSLHPDHFTLLNSPLEDVQQTSIRDLDYHVKILEAMNLDDEAKLVLHVGGKYHSKEEALIRFKQQFRRLPQRIKSRIVLENDDRSFTASDVLHLCQEINVPMVLDVHHHHLLNSGESLDSLLPQIFNTWGHLIPKVHLSSPRDEKSPRSHADFIQPEAAVNFLNRAGSIGKDFDIMLEAKQKDLALIRLSTQLQNLGYQMTGLGEISL